MVTKGRLTCSKSITGKLLKVRGSLHVEVEVSILIR